MQLAIHALQAPARGRLCLTNPKSSILIPLRHQHHPNPASRLSSSRSLSTTCSTAASSSEAPVTDWQAVFSTGQFARRRKSPRLTPGQNAAEKEILRQVRLTHPPFSKEEGRARLTSQNVREGTRRSKSQVTSNGGGQKQRAVTPKASPTLKPRTRRAWKKAFRRLSRVKNLLEPWNRGLDMEAQLKERLTLLKRLREWVDREESLESELVDPFTEKQFKAIQALLPTTTARPTSGPRPDPSLHIGTEDWISRLQHVLAKHRFPLPSYKDEAVEVDGYASLQWRTWCVIHDGTTFPSEGFGIRNGGEAPFFTTKKIAKQFAARQALRKVEDMYKVHTTWNTPSVAGKTASAGKGLSSTPPAKRPNVEAPVGVEAGAAQHSSTSAVPTADASSVLDALRRTSVSLGLPPPDIETEPDKNFNEGFFKGRAVFAPWAKVPDGLGTKIGILNEDECRVKVAQEVLEWMKHEMNLRKQMAESLINRNGQ